MGERGQEEDELPPDCHGLNIGWEKGRTREIAIGEGVVIGLNWNAEEKVVSMQKRGRGVFLQCETLLSRQREFPGQTCAIKPEENQRPGERTR